MRSKNTLDSSLPVDFETLYTTYYPRMFRFAKVYVGSDAEAENIVQDVFLHIWEKKEVIRIQGSVLSYLLSIVKYRALDWFRHQMHVEEHKEEYVLRMMALQKVQDSPFQEEELKKQIWDAINKLPEKCRVIFIKSRFEGKKNREIAQELNISVNTVENQMGIALKKLKTDLKDYLPFLLLVLKC